MTWCSSSTLCIVYIYLSLGSWRGVLDTSLCDKVCHWLPAGRWFSLGSPVSSTKKTDSHDITEILLKVALNTITLSPTLIPLFLPLTLSMLHKTLFSYHWLHGILLVDGACDIKHSVKTFKEYLKLLNRLYDITWFGSVYA